MTASRSLIDQAYKFAGCGRLRVAVRGDLFFQVGDVALHLGRGMAANLRIGRLVMKLGGFLGLGHGCFVHGDRDADRNVMVGKGSGIGWFVSIWRLRG